MSRARLICALPRRRPAATRRLPRPRAPRAGTRRRRTRTPRAAPRPTRAPAAPAAGAAARALPLPATSSAGQPHRPRRPAGRAAGIGRAARRCRSSSRGPSDRIGTPARHAPAARRGAGRPSATAPSVSTRAAAGGVTLVVDAPAYDRVRYVFVNGNWPIRQDEIQRRITIRPGRPLPPPGAERDRRARARARCASSTSSAARATSRPTSAWTLGPARTNPRAVDLYVDDRHGPATRSAPITFTGNQRHPHRGDRPDVPPLRPGTTPWLAPGAVHAEAAAPRHREALDEALPRARLLRRARHHRLLDRSSSVDRVAKNVRLGDPDQRAQEDHGRVRGQQPTVVVHAARRADAARRAARTTTTRSAASADAIQRYYQSGRLLLRAGRLAARAAVRRRGAHRVHHRRGPASCSVRGDRVRRQPVAVRATELADVVSVRKYPPLGARLRAATSPASRWSRTSSASSSTTSARGFLEAKARAEAATSREALGQLGRRRRRRRHRRRATRRRSSSASPSRRVRA